jgi:hypothetical protein
MEQTAVRMVPFYVDDGVLSSRDPVWLQSAYDVLIDVFDRVSL